MYKMSRNKEIKRINPLISQEKTEIIRSPKTEEEKMDSRSFKPPPNNRETDIIKDTYKEIPGENPLEISEKEIDVVETQEENTT